MKRIIYGILAIMVLQACGNQEVEKNTGENDKTSATCTVDTVKRESINPNGETELALLMRKMDADLKAFRTEMKNGQIAEITFDHSTINTAEPTKKDLRDNADFTAYANSYLMGIENLKSASKDSVASKYNQLVAKCIQCHNTFCTGPITRIKKLKVNAENIHFN